MVDPIFKKPVMEQHEQILTEAFSRFHAQRQHKFDSLVSMIGALMYISMLPIVYRFGVIHVGVVIGLATATAWPLLLSSWNKQIFFKWRDVFFSIHFLLHHAIAPMYLLTLGITMRDQLISANHIGFLVGFLTSSTVLWQCLNMLMYRLKFKVFCFMQPLILLTVMPNEWKHCAWASTKPIAHEVFSSITHFADLMLAAVFPAFFTVASEEHIAMTTYENCIAVHTWMLFFFGFIVPAPIIWKLERQAWITFLLTPPQQLTWPGGPSVNQLGAALLEGQKEQVRINEEDGEDKRLPLLTLLASASLWLIVRVLL